MPVIVKYGINPPLIIMEISGREPYIERDKARAQQLIVDLCEAFNKVFDPPKPREEKHDGHGT